MKALELIIPPPIVMLVIGVIMWLLSMLFPAFPLSLTYNVATAIVIGLVGIGISMAGILDFKRARTTTDPRKPANASALVTSGIYRFSRNPMYVGILLVLIGWGVFLGNALALIGAFAFVPYISRYQIQPEERLLQDKFGAEFTEYKARVRRWL